MGCRGTTAIGVAERERSVFTEVHHENQREIHLPSTVVRDESVDLV